MTNRFRIMAAGALVATVCTGKPLQAPFQMPHNAQPKRLIGGMDLEGPTVLAFDSRNRPYMFDAREPEHFGYILTLRDGKWIRLDYLKALQKALPEVVLPTKRYHHARGTLAIDGKDRLYAVVRADVQWFLLYSDNLGETFQILALPGTSFLEIYTGHNQSDLPPAIGCLRLRKKHPARFAEYHNLDVFLPVITDEGLQLGAPIPVSPDCFGMSNHSGGYSFAVTRGATTYVAYGVIPEDGKDGHGNPTYVATIDRNTRQVIARQHIADADPPQIDCHSTPVITNDSDGVLHALAGAHNNTFKYLHTTKARATDWSAPEPQCSDIKQSYATLVCDSQNRLHCVYRHSGTTGNLSYVSKAPNASTWSDPVMLVDHPTGHKGYNVFYHRLFIDRADTLYLSFTFFEFKTGQDGQYPRALAMSTDGGASWQIATTAAMQARAFSNNKDRLGAK